MDDARIQNLVSQFHTRYELVPVTAAEIECYAEIYGDVDGWWQPLHDHWRAHHMPLLRIEKERGEHQYELVLGLDSPQGTADALAHIRADIENYARTSNTPVSFDAKPYGDQPSSGLHMHVHLQNADGANMFIKDGEKLSPPLAYTLGGLLTCMPVALAYYCPNDSDYVRFDDGDHVPRRNCWGANNRYCALRIPPTQEMFDKHVELRVPSSNANAYDVMTAMLSSMMIGFNRELWPGEQEFGKPDADFLNDVKSQVPESSISAAFLSVMHAKL